VLRGRFFTISPSSRFASSVCVCQPPVVRVRTRVGYDVFFCFCLCGGAGGERRSACIAQAQQRCSSGKATSAVLCEAVGRAVRARPHRRCSARQWSCSSSTAAKATTSTLGGPLSPDMAAKLAALKTSDKVMARGMLTVPAIELVHELGTVPTFEVVEMSKNLKTVRRELRAACEERWKLRDEVHNLKQELPPSRSAWGQ